MVCDLMHTFPLGLLGKQHLLKWLVDRFTSEHVKKLGLKLGRVPAMTRSVTIRRADGGQQIGLSLERTSDGQLIVVNVVSGSPAAAAGIVIGATILSVAGTPVVSVAGMRDAMGSSTECDVCDTTNQADAQLW
eukprot:gene41954-49775_t